MIMLEDQGVPKVSARLRWSQGVLNFQNSPTPRVVLLSIKIDTRKKNHHSAFQKTECPCMQTFCFIKCLAAFYAL